jgi:hypothetical protein
MLHAGTFLADAGFLAPGNILLRVEYDWINSVNSALLYGSKSENYYLEPASNRSEGT